MPNESALSESLPNPCSKDHEKFWGKVKSPIMFSMSPLVLDLYGKRVCKITYLSLNAGDPVDAEPGADKRHQGL